MNRFNSTIRQKTCKNISCSKYPKLGYKGYCGFGCMPESMREVETVKTATKRKNQISAQISKNLHRVANDKENTKRGQESAKINPQGQQSLWFIDRMDRFQPKCENCGAEKAILKLPKFGRQWKSCQAHLLPKRHFESLKTHPLNGMVLGSGYSGLCHCHDNYDASWEKAAKMNIWDEVVRRFLIMYPLITPEEHQYIPPQLLQELPENQT